jgi:hypothetical protein
LGASFADWLDTAYLDGLGLGDAWVSLVLALPIVGFIGYLTISEGDLPDVQARSPLRWFA